MTVEVQRFGSSPVAEVLSPDGRMLVGATMLVTVEGLDDGWLDTTEEEGGAVHQSDEGE